MGPAAGALSLASVGMSAYGKILGGEANSAEDTYKSEQLAFQAQEGELKATQTNAQMTRNLTITLGNIDAVRAAAHTDPSSPTGAAVRNYTEQQGDIQKQTTVDSIMAQSYEDEAGGAYLRDASQTALLSGNIGAAAAGVNGLAGLFKGPGGNTGGTSVYGAFNSGNPIY